MGPIPLIPTKSVLTNFMMLGGAMGAGIGLDIGGLIAAIVGTVAGVAAGAMGYGMLSGSVKEHERRLNAMDSAAIRMTEALEEHRTEFSRVAQDIGYLAGQARLRDSGVLHTREDDHR